jgi:diaminopimelate decarboxylase
MSPYFHYQQNALFAENIPLTAIANTYGTPCYVYSRSALENNYRAFDTAFGQVPHQVCYAVKANSNIAILNILSQLNAGFDIVSQGELERVLAAKGDPKKVIFSGVGKSTAEIERALQVNIHCFNIESQEELDRLHHLAKQANKIANIALRVNPNIDALTHPYISTGLRDNKFGIEMEQSLVIAEKTLSLPHVKLIGIACHIGSQLTELNPILEATDRLLELITLLKQKGFALQHIDVGGGLGICYQNESIPSIENYVSALCQKCHDHSLEIIIAPGRAITATAGILLTRIEYLKHTSHKNFAVVDAAMNDFMRPALYEAWQTILPVIRHAQQNATHYDIVGPVCESADFLGKDRLLTLQVGDLLAIQDTGAYGFTMSSNYNSRPRAAEILVDRETIHLIRPRETIDALFSSEQLIS